MDDWKRQINYNFHSSYHTYAFGLLYQSGAEHGNGNGNPNNGNPSGWGEAGFMDLGNYNAGVNQAYYAASAAKTLGDCPPQSPGQHAVSGSCQYQGSGFVYLGDPQPGRLVLSAQQQTAYDDRGSEVRRAQSESASDSEARASPDSWRSGSSRDGSLPQVDPTTWVRKDAEYEVSDGAPIVCQEVSNCLIEEPGPLAVTGNQNINTTYAHVPIPSPKKAVNATKGKVRAAFSESQMNILVQRFSVQRYLTPAEMKSLAELTGLTYKQVKTWFQNRRMKLRRHQKDNSWVCERYNANKGGPLPGNMYSNVPPHMPPPHLKEHYNQHMMDAAYRKTTPQNLAFYLAAMGNAAGPVGYPAWSSSSSQSAVPPRSQVDAWSMPQSVGHYEYNPNAFNPAAANDSVKDPSFESQDVEPANSSCSLRIGVINNAIQ